MEAIPLTVIATFADCPACNVPDAGEKFRLPIRLDGSETDHESGPPEAVIVRMVAPSALSTTVAGETAIVPGVTAGAVVGVREGWVGAGAGEGDFDADPVGEGDGAFDAGADLVAVGVLPGAGEVG